MTVIRSLREVNGRASNYLVYDEKNRLADAYIRVRGIDGKPSIYLWYDVDDYVFLEAFPEWKIVKQMEAYFDGRNWTVITVPHLDLGIMDKSLYKLNKPKAKPTVAKTMKCGCTKAPAKRVVRKAPARNPVRK